jgi:hypothetical protein
MSEASGAAATRERGKSPRANGWIWRVFWIGWASLLGVMIAWSTFVESRRDLFARSYTLGVDEVREEHELAWLAESRYYVAVIFQEPRDRAGLDSRPTFRDAIGGDIAGELVTDSGEVVIPRQFVLGEGRAEWRDDFHPFDYRTYSRKFYGAPTAARVDDPINHPSAFRSGLFERYRLRIETWKGAVAPYPQEVFVTCNAGLFKGPPMWVGWIVFFAIVVVPSALLLWFFLWLARKRGTGGKKRATTYAQGR